MFWSKNKKHYVYTCKPQFYYIKVGCKGVYITQTCFHDVITTELSRCKAAGKSGIVAEMQKLIWEAGAVKVCDLIKHII